MKKWLGVFIMCFVFITVIIHVLALLGLFPIWISLPLMFISLFGAVFFFTRRKTFKGFNKS